jgi:hypothetical protein
METGEQAMSAALTWGGVAVCAVVICACICRIDQLKAGRHRFGWILLYLLLAPFALGVAIDLVLGRPVDWYVSVGMAGVLLQLFLTRKDWRFGVPADIVKEKP